MSDVPVHPPLSILERRVLGVLIEKHKTSKSPDAYPMTLNALTTGCNQKSNRDPVLDLDEDQVEATLMDLSKRLLTQKIVGGRAERWKHDCYNQWKASGTGMAVLAELLLRGPQTEGELRGRASRMNDIPDLDALREHLKDLCEKGLAKYLTSSGRGAMVTHGFHGPDEAMPAASAAEPIASTRTAAGDVESRFADLQAQLDDVKARLAKLEGTAT